MCTPMATTYSVGFYLFYAWQNGWFSKIWSHLVFIESHELLFKASLQPACYIAKILIDYLFIYLKLYNCRSVRYQVLQPTNDIEVRTICLKSCRQEKKSMMHQDSLEPAAIRFTLEHLQESPRQSAAGYFLPTFFMHLYPQEYNTLQVYYHPDWFVLSFPFNHALLPQSSHTVVNKAVTLTSDEMTWWYMHSHENNTYTYRLCSMAADLIKIHLNLNVNSNKTMQLLYICACLIHVSHISMYDPDL